MIRRLREIDLAAVEAIFSRSFSFPVGDLYISWSQRSKKDSVGVWTSTASASSSAPKLIGFMIASFHSSTGESMYVDYFAIDPEYRGSGLGTKLLLDLVTESYDKRGSVHVYPERDDIVPWYERNGFRRTRGGYYVFHSYDTRAQREVHRRLGLA
jgi:ribosomal protein S18 acetylase RimI-like enzyme